MSSPVNINIHIRVGADGGVEVGGPRAARLGLVAPKFVGAGDPASAAQYQSGDPICVRPSADSNLGTIAIWFSYETVYDEVVAITYPEKLTHDDDQPPVGKAQAGVKSSGGLKWTWTSLYGADYSAAPGRPNRVHLWYRTGGGTWTKDAIPFAFYGITHGTGTCGSGSGTGSQTGTGTGTGR